MNKVDEMVEPNAPAQSLCGLNAVLRKIQTGYPTTALAGKPARRPAYAATYVEHMMLAVNSCEISQRVQNFDATIVILIKVLEIVLGQGVDRQAARGDLGENLILIDRMGVI
jgi:hypothetical protein